MTGHGEPEHDEPRLGPAEDVRARVDAHRALAVQVTGLPAAEAAAQLESAGLRVRTVDLDDPGGGRRRADLRADRVTLYVRGGVVERAEAG